MGLVSFQTKTTLVVDSSHPTCRLNRSRIATQKTTAAAARSTADRVVGNSTKFDVHFRPNDGWSRWIHLACGLMNSFSFVLVQQPFGCNGGMWGGNPNRSRLTFPLTSRLSFSANQFGAVHTYFSIYYLSIMGGWRFWMLHKTMLGILLLPSCKLKRTCAHSP